MFSILWQSCAVWITRMVIAEALGCEFDNQSNNCSSNTSLSPPQNLNFVIKKNKAHFNNRFIHFIMAMFCADGKHIVSTIWVSIKSEGYNCIKYGLVLQCQNFRRYFTHFPGLWLLKKNHYKSTVRSWKSVVFIQGDFYPLTMTDATRSARKLIKGHRGDHNWIVSIFEEKG